MKNIDDLLYPDFLQDEEVYDQLEAYWKEAVVELEEENEKTFQPYINQFDAEGNKYRVANPIISLLDTDSNRGIRIIQYPIEEAESIFVSAFFNELPIEEDHPIQELVIDVVLTEETQSKAMEWIKLWLIDYIEEEQMDELIEAELEVIE